MNITDPQVSRFIRRAMVARIATLSRSGRPSVTPLYFTFTQGHLWLGTADWTLAAREVKANPQVSVLLQHEHDHHDPRVLRITGTAIVRTDPKTVRIRNIQTAFKYVLTPGGIYNQIANWKLSAAVRQYRAQSAGKGLTCVIDVIPDTVEFLG